METVGEEITMGASRKDLEILRREQVYRAVYFSDEESEKFKTMLQNNEPMTEGVYELEGRFYKYIDTDLSEKELTELLLLQQNKYLNLIEKHLSIQKGYLGSIKGGVIFFVTLTVITLSLGLLILMALLA